MNLFVEHFDIIIQLLFFIFITTGSYYKFRFDLKTINAKIEDIKEDRKIRWQKYESQKDKAENKSNEQYSKFNEVAIGIGKIQNDLSWLKNKK